MDPANNGISPLRGVVARRPALKRLAKGPAMHHARLRSSALPVLVVTLGLLVAGCSSLPRTPYSVADASSARVLDLVDLRRNADEPAGSFMQANHQVMWRGPRTYLALSGGGADGAYGAGLLNGWSEAGTRPSFAIVSGVSTGALIAPFAFLGSEYDATLRDIYTSGIAASLLEDPNPLKAIFGSGLFGNAKMRELAAKYYDANVVAAVAVEYAKGRQLAIVTTNIDSQRTVIWDMGRIASLGTPESLRLFQDVVAASASVPVVFEPMLITAAANGRQFQEMHIDGGVTAPVLTLPEAFLLRNAAPAKPENLQLFILINNKVEREFQLVTNSTVEIAARSSSTMLKTQTRSILYNTYAFARRNKFGFNLTYIEGDRPLSPAGFDTAYMRELFQYGYDRARSGHVWSQSPPADNNEAPSASRIAAAR